jgi:hypothetical protein
MRVWRNKNTAYSTRNIQPTVPYVEGSIMVWVCVSHDCKLMSVCQQWTFNDSPWLKSRWFQTVSNCSCWQTSIGQSVLFEYGTGCEWHPSKQTMLCPVVTIKCYPWSAGSWQVYPLCLILTSHTREPCFSRITHDSVCLRFDFGYFLKNVFILSKHGTKANIRSTKMADIRHNGYTYVSTSF